MRTLSLSCLGMALTVSVMAVGVLPLLAAEPPVQTGTDRSVTVTGRIIRERPVDRQFTLQTIDGKELGFTVGSHSQLMRHQREAQLSAFKVGSRVRVSYEPAAGINRVLTLRDAPVTVAEVQRELNEALESAKEYTFQQKAEYQKKLQPVLRDLDDRIEHLQEQAKGAGKQAQKWYAQAIQELQGEKAKVDKQLAKVQAAAPGAWNDVKAGVSAAWGDLQRAFQRANERLQQGESSNRP